MDNVYSIANARTRKLEGTYLDAQKKQFIQGDIRKLAKLCTDCAEILQKEFNGDGHFAWGCSPTPDGSVINIRLFADGLHGMYGWTIDTIALQQETGRRAKLINAGGEILERYHLDNQRKITDIKLKRNTRGEVIPEQ